MKKILLFACLLWSGAMLFAQYCEVTISGEPILCSTDDVTTLTATPGFEYYYWNTGEEGISIEVGRGVYWLYAVREDGCLAYDRFDIALPKQENLIGGIRVEDSLILDAYYTIPVNDPTYFSFIWLLDGDTISNNNFVEIDMVGAITDTFDLTVIYENLCSGLIGSFAYKIKEYDEIIFSDTSYVCANAPNINVYGRSVEKSGSYFSSWFTDFGVEATSFIQYEFLEDSCAIYDTISWCINPFTYGGEYIDEVGSYEALEYELDTAHLLYLEVIQDSSFRYSIDTLEFCGSGPYQYNGYSYNFNPWMYTRYYDIGDGCDSIVLERLIPPDNPITTTVIDTAICEGETLEWQGEIYEAGSVIELSYPLAFDCDSTVLLTIESLPLPILSIEATLCEGDTIVVDGHFYYEEGEYTYQKEAIIGCDTIVNVFIQLNPPIEASDVFILPDDGSSVGGIFINLSGGTPPYELLWSNGSTTQNIFNLEAGEYHLVIVDANGCSVLFSYEVPLVTGVNEYGGSSIISLSPNPFSDYLWVNIPASWKDEKLTLELFNTLGQLVWYTKEIDETIQLDVGSLPNGFYTYCIKGGVGIILSQGSILKS